LELFDDLAVDAYAPAVGTLRVELLSAGISVVQLRAVEQGEDVRVNMVPQLMAQRRTQVLDDELVARLAVPAATAAFGNGESDFRHGGFLHCS